MLRKPAALFVVLFFMLSVDILFAQTLGTAPMLNKAVQGQNGAQPEGAFFNFINWIGNVVAPIGGCIRALPTRKAIPLAQNFATVSDKSRSWK